MQSMYVGPPFICRAACRLKLGDYSGAVADCNEVQLTVTKVQSWQLN